jgi:dihydroorotate dehydrogenase (NAD+) catalytic subunit
MAPMSVCLSPRTGFSIGAPVIAASGVFGYGIEFAARMSLQGLGAVICKGTTLEPRTGNGPLRMAETPAGMLNAIGLQNIGVDALIRDKAPVWASWSVPVLVNVSGSSIDEFVEIARRLDGVPGVSGIELNFSCPNVKEGGIAFGVDPIAAAAATSAVRNVTELPLLVKLTPNVTDIRPIAAAVEAAGADAISLINTLYGMTIDPKRRSPTLDTTRGGLSGPAIKPYALHLVYEVAQEVTVPIVGLGGILSGLDAAEFLLAGAGAVALGTALLADPTAWRRVAAELQQWLDRQGARTVDEIVGAANPRFKSKARETNLAGR